MSAHAMPAVAGDKPRKSTTQKLAGAWPQILELVAPRKWLFLGGLVLVGINRLSALVLPASTKYLVDDVVGKRHIQLLLPLVVAVMVATAIQGISSFSLTQLLSKAAQRSIAEMRSKVQEHIGRLPVAYYDANKTGALVSRIMSDVEGIRNLFGTGMVDFVGGLLTAIFAFFVLLHISKSMTLLAFGMLAVFAVGVGRTVQTIRPTFRERAKIGAEVSGRLSESLSGVRVVKGYHAEDREAAIFTAGAQRLLENVLRTLTATSLMSLASSIFVGIVGAMMMYIGGHEMVSGTLTIGQFFSFTMFMAFLVAPIVQIVSIGTQLNEAVAGLDRTREVLSEAREDTDPRRTVNIGSITGDVHFEHVEFAYDPSQIVLHDVSFAAKSDTVTALVGSSGSGKSTIIGLVSAFHVPLSGRVMVDGIDLSTVKLGSYRTQLGVVLQESFLFDGTIRENVAFSRPKASEAQIMEACRIARVEEFTEQFERGYDTIVGERGVKLSGGQRQRISIARAILADPRILILDEATSSLDSESEAMIQEGLRYLMRGRTTFVIAHRLSTIRSADQILVLEAGRIVESGNHESLYTRKGRYYDLYTRQHGVETNLFLAPGEGDKILEEEQVAGGKPAADPATLLRGPI